MVREGLMSMGRVLCQCVVPTHIVPHHSVPLYAEQVTTVTFIVLAEVKLVT